MRRNTPTSCVLIVLLSVTAAPLAAQQPEPRPLFVEGYTDQLSYIPGEEVVFHLSTTAANVSMAIARVGASNETVSSITGKFTSRSGQSRTASQSTMPSTAIWSFIPRYLRAIGWC